MIEIVPFSELSEALMSSLASRSHEWVQWQIREVLERSQSADVAMAQASPAELTIELTVDVPLGPKPALLESPPLTVGRSTLKLYAGSSPSLSVAQALAKAAENPLAYLPLADHTKSLNSTTSNDFAGAGTLIRTKNSLGYFEQQLCV